MADGVWRSIRDRDDLQVMLVELPGGIEGVSIPEPWGWAILIDRRLSAVERRAVLAHELAHLEVGGGAEVDGMPASWAAVVARDEARADRRAAVRMIDVAALERLRASGEVLTVHEVAEALGVPVWALSWVA